MRRTAASSSLSTLFSSFPLSYPPVADPIDPMPSLMASTEMPYPLITDDIGYNFFEPKPTAINLYIKGIRPESKFLEKLMAYIKAVKNLPLRIQSAQNKPIETCLDTSMQAIKTEWDQYGETFLSPPPLSPKSVAEILEGEPGLTLYQTSNSSIVALYENTGAYAIATAWRPLPYQTYADPVTVLTACTSPISAPLPRTLSFKNISLPRLRFSLVIAPESLDIGFIVRKPKSDTTESSVTTQFIGVSKEI